MSTEPMAEWDYWSHIGGPSPDLQCSAADLPILIDQHGRSQPYRAVPFGFSTTSRLVHPWPTATVTVPTAEPKARRTRPPLFLKARQVWADDNHLPTRTLRAALRAPLTEESR